MGDIEIRPYGPTRTSTRSSICSGRALGPAPGGADRRELFVWKHLDNHFGRSIALVAEEDGGIVGLRAFMRWAFNRPGG